jgi:ribosomal protein S3AE
MIQSNQNSIKKAMFAMILHTLQECELEENQNLSLSENEKDSIVSDEKNSYTFIEI